MSQFVGLKIQTSSGDVGIVHSAFGTSGKFRVNFPAGTDVREGEKLILRFKRYANDKRKGMHQDVVVPEASPGALVIPDVKETKKSKTKKKSIDRIKENRHKQDGASQVGTISLDGEIISLKPDNIVVVAGFFSPEINIREKLGWNVQIVGTDEVGSIIAPFGKAGKCKVFFQDGLTASEGSKVRLVEES